jgi:HD-like signal output (HDOD) protein
MNKIEQLHLEVIKNQYDLELYESIEFIQDESKETASKSAEITEQIAIEFAEWLNKNASRNAQGAWEYFGNRFYEKTSKELYEEFLKTKQ